MSADPDSRLDIFYKLWTIKEAFAKAMGRGLSLSMKDLVISLNSMSIFIAPHLIEDCSYWDIQTFQPTFSPADLTCYIGVAIKTLPGSSLSFSYREVRLNELLSNLQDRS